MATKSYRTKDGRLAVLFNSSGSLDAAIAGSTIDAFETSEWPEDSQAWDPRMAKVIAGDFLGREASDEDVASAAAKLDRLIGRAERVVFMDDFALGLADEVAAEAQAAQDEADEAERLNDPATLAAEAEEGARRKAADEEAERAHHAAQEALGPIPDDAE